VVVIIVPVLGRPHRVAPLMASIEKATPEPHRTLFVASETDKAEVRALAAAGADYFTVPARHGTWAKKINAGYRASTEPYIFTAADDLLFHPEWLGNALAMMADGIGVVGTNDLCNPRTMQGDHATHSLVSRAYVEEFGTIDEPGKILHEGYPHDYADDELVATAIARGAYAHALDSVVEHLHPWAKKAPDDATYRLGRRHRARGRQLFRRRQRLWLR
jgi:glycosyltransferase involved in cell wall biosynthesis